jgi:N-acetylneuraminic acid mutarotase
VEIFDPLMESWDDASSMLGPRERHTAAVIDGLVVVVGGVGVRGGLPRAVSTTEVYYPAQDQWADLGDLGGVAVGHTTTLLDGALLVVSNGVGAMTKTWYSHWYPAGAMRWPRSNHVAIRMRDGRVLVAGGTPYQTLLTPEIFDPKTGAWTSTADQPLGIWGGSATLLDDGRVLVISGEVLIFSVTPPR